MNRYIPGACLVLIATAVMSAQKPWVDPSKFSQPPTSSWPTYNGDYSGRRFSPLTKITADNVQSLSLAWSYRTAPGARRRRPDQGHADHDRRRDLPDPARSRVGARRPYRP